jgi:hypothetical protein
MYTSTSGANSGTSSAKTNSNHTALASHMVSVDPASDSMTAARRSDADHSSLAMQAARRMRRVKHKRKNSKVICHHLIRMINEEAPVCESSSVEGTSSIPGTLVQCQQISLGI